MSDSIEFLELSDLIEIHLDQIANDGGTPEIRDLGILESAIEQPRATFGGSFLHSLPFEIAAAYLFDGVKNHPFVDGNKRAGTVAALVFQRWSGLIFRAAAGELSELTLAVATGLADKQEIAAFLQERCVNQRDFTERSSPKSERLPSVF